MTHKHKEALICLIAWLVGTTAFAAAPAQNEKDSASQRYMRSITSKVRKNWAPHRTSEPLKVRVGWQQHSDGSISNLHVCNPGINPSNEKLAIEAVLKSAPFAPLPPGSRSEDIELHLESTSVLRMTVPKAIDTYGPSAREFLRARCRAAGIAYPPKQLTLIGLKQEKLLLLYSGDAEKKLIASFPLVSYSGNLGPKLRQGDLQIPEGIYRITHLESYNMLALGVNYPNELDSKNAVHDHRTKLGGDILVHGGSLSTGCLVVSNEDMEQVFVAVYDVGCINTKLVIAPCDLRKTKPAIDMGKQPVWLPDLYKSLRERMLLYPLPNTNDKLRMTKP